MSYFCIFSDEDGIYVRQYSTKRELLEIIESDVKCGMRYHFFKTLPNIYDGQITSEYPIDKLAVVIIKGEIIVPKPVATVTSYQVD